MRKNENTQHIEGRLYQHNLEIKTVKNQTSENFGKEFISGTMDIAVDEAGLNVLQVHFTYVTPTTKKGSNNPTFNVLKKIIEEGKTWVTSGPTEATMVRVANNAIALNDFYAQDGTLVSAKVNEGGFVSIVKTLCKEEERNTFVADAIITSAKEVEANDTHENDYLVLKGAIFNFRNDILPFDFVVNVSDGISYFLGQDISPSNPLYTKLHGRINCTTIVTQKEEESAFGEPIVTNSTRHAREWEVTQAKRVPYLFDDESTITADELTKAMQDREVYLAERKKQAEEYRAQSSQGATVASGFPTASATAPMAAKGSFNF